MRSRGPIHVRNLRADHLPFPMPPRPHALRQSWLDLTFLHWEVEPEQLHPFLPAGLELDLFEERAYVGIIPFVMSGVRPRWAIPLPGVSRFPEFNIRLYVRHQDRPGVLFLTLEAQSRITCWFAPRFYGLPYRYSRGWVEADSDTHAWSTSRRDGTHGFAGCSKAEGEIRTAVPGSLEHFLFERYALYTTHRNKLQIAYTHHIPWEFRDGRVDLTTNDLGMRFSLGLTSPLEPDLVHMSTGVEVRTWSIQEVHP